MTTISNPWRWTVLALLLAFFAAEAHAQYSPGYTPPPPPLTTAPCVPSKKDPCAAPPAAPPSTPASTGKFPFPGDSAAQNAPAPAVGSSAGSSDKFPFPGETPAAPAVPPSDNKFAFPGEPPAASSSGSSSSSSSSPSGSAPDADPARSAPAPVPRSGRRKLPKVEQSLSDRESEDLNVSHFYLQSGNFLGAYLRAQDAVKSIPDDADAHFALALAAQKMKKNDEAVTEFKTYLKMMPDGGDHTRAAERGLADLNAK